jgi:hypothetical protein
MPKTPNNARRRTSVDNTQLLESIERGNQLLAKLLQHTGALAFEDVVPLDTALAAAAPAAQSHTYTRDEVAEIVTRLVGNYTPLRPIRPWYVLGNLGVPLHLLARDINITFQLPPEKRLGSNSIQSTWTVGVLIAVVYGILSH